MESSEKTKCPSEWAAGGKTPAAAHGLCTKLTCEGQSKFEQSTSTTVNLNFQPWHSNNTLVQVDIHSFEVGQTSILHHVAKEVSWVEESGK
jgi:hypothetical protein